MRTIRLLCLLLFLTGCSSGGGGSARPDAAADRDAGGTDGSDASPDAAASLADASADAATLDAAVDAGLHVVGREDLAGLALNGSIPPADVPAPDFSATAHTGEPRTRADLLGRRTVMWFYPQAYTGG